MAIKVTSFKPFQKNTLQGFLTIRLTGVGLEVRDCCLHQKDDKRWIQMPAKPYQKPDGSQGWAFILDFFDKTRGEQFQKLAIEALDLYRKSGQEGRDGF